MIAVEGTLWSERGVLLVDGGEVQSSLQGKASNNEVGIDSVMDSLGPALRRTLLVDAETEAD